MCGLALYVRRLKDDDFKNVSCTDSSRVTEDTVANILEHSKSALFQMEFGFRSRKRTSSSTVTKFHILLLQNTVSKLLSSFFKEDKTRRE